MIGAIYGDIAGSAWEGSKNYDGEEDLINERSKFTDDTVLTVAIADILLNKTDPVSTIKDYYNDYSDRGFGGGFSRWAESVSRIGYGSYGNGAAMRVSSIPHVFTELQVALKSTKLFTDLTHNHGDAVRGAKAIVHCAWAANRGKGKKAIESIARNYHYDLDNAEDSDTKENRCSCNTTVPLAIRSFLDGENFDDTIVRAVQSGWDSDTIACMAATIAEPYYFQNYEIPTRYKKIVFQHLDENLGSTLLDFIQTFVREDFDPEEEIKDNIDVDSLLEDMFTS